jgi:CelD/BcsL family acetyltransferase involved in cellulose biosynthesis
LTAARLNDAEVSTDRALSTVHEPGGFRFGAATRLHSQLISDVQSWDTCRARIDNLLSTTSLPNPHSTTAWQRMWWQSLAGDRSLRIGLWWDGAELVGYAPLMLTTEHLWGVPRQVLRFIGDGISDYADLYCRDDRRDVAEAMAKDIVESWEWDELQLSNVRGGSTTIAAFQQYQSPRYFARVGPVERCLYIDLRNRTFEQYYRSLSRNHRRELQKRRHKLDALGNWSVRFEQNVPAEALFDEFRALHTARSEAMGWTSLYDLAGFREFFVELMQSRRKDIEVLCSTLRHEHRLMSYTLGFVHRGVYYHWNIGFDAAYEAIAPNKLHHQFLIEECFRRHYLEFDFMRGEYEYKYKWTDAFRENYGIRFLRRYGWRRAMNSVLWLQERAPDSVASRVIDGTRLALRTLKAAVVVKGPLQVSADPEEKQT